MQFVYLHLEPLAGEPKSGRAAFSRFILKLDMHEIKWKIHSRFINASSIISFGGLGLGSPIQCNKYLIYPSLDCLSS